MKVIITKLLITMKIILGNEITNPPSAPVETELGSFSTNIIDKRENRQNNIRITCSKLNGYTIESGKTFSFCKTVRKINCTRRI